MDIKNTFGTLLLALLSLSPIQASAAGDSLFSLQWGMKNTGQAQKIAIDHYTNGYVDGVPGEDIDLPPPAADSASPHLKKVIVATLDTGIDFSHPQLKEALAGKGANFVDPKQDPIDTHGHGTHVAGIIAARPATDHGIDSGLRGVSQNALILPVKVVQTGPNAPIHPQDTSPGGGTALTENVAKGLVYAIQNGAQVINLSLAWPVSIHSKAVDDAMELAREKNVIVVSSAGNDGTVANVYPCIYENVVCVGAHGPDGSFAHYSNYGQMVDVLAPGTAILSTWPMNKAPSTFAGQVGYEFRNGTSMAAPFVAGAIAELISRGYSPMEAKNRVLLGSRPTSPVTKFSSEVAGNFSKNTNTEAKTARFGNLDIARAISIPASPLILPLQKAPYALQWDGTSPAMTLPIVWKNSWIASGKTEITVNGQHFSFDSVPEGGTVTTPITVDLSRPDLDSTLHFRASVSTDGYEKSGIEIEVQITRMIRSDLFPANATVKTLVGLGRYTTIRSVVNADTDPRADWLFIDGSVSTPAAPSLRMTLVQDSQVNGATTLTGVTEDDLLNLYRLPDQTYAAIFTVKVKDSYRPNFLIQYFDSTLTPTRQITLGTDVTVLSENFRWIKSGDGYAPMWISVGFTPPLDKPAYDPWNPNARDSKMPRLFYLSGQDLRIIPMTNTQLPLQLMPDGRVLIADGVGYLVQYFLITVENGKITQTEPITLSTYEMLVGLQPGATLLNLDGSRSQTLVISDNSMPGDLRMTGLPASFDTTLSRASPLEPLVQPVGAFSDGSHHYFFAQSYYDLKFFAEGSNTTISTTLNRYSYIPSMIFNRNFYPLVVRDSRGTGMPAVYIPATIANDFVSEIIAADPRADDSSGARLYRPARLRLATDDPTCTAMGNLIPATESTPAQEVFVCGSTLIRVPLTLKR